MTTKTPLNQLKSNAPIDPRTLAPPPPAPKTDLTIDKRENINIGTSHNRAPMPFNREVGNSIDYKAKEILQKKIIFFNDYFNIYNSFNNRLPNQVIGHRVITLNGLAEMSFRSATINVII